MSRVLWLAVALVATPALADTPLGDALRAEGKAPHYVTAGKKGVVVHTIDGKPTRTLVTGPIGAAMIDAVWELVWFVKDRKLWVLDLRDAKPAPRVMITDVPEWAGFRVVTDDGEAIEAAPQVIVLNWGPEESLVEVNENAIHYEDGKRDAEVRFDRQKAAAGKAKLAADATDWLKANKGRKSRASAVGAIKPFLLAPDKLLLPGLCEDDDPVCGRHTALGATGLRLVIVRPTCDGDDGNACGRRCAVYDPVKKRFSSLFEPTNWVKKATRAQRGLCDPEMSAEGKAWLGSRNLVCSPKGCRKEPDAILGWLDRGDKLDTEDTRLQGEQP
jgi:hypothetical protein